MTVPPLSDENAADLPYSLEARLGKLVGELARSLQASGVGELDAQTEANLCVLSYIP